MSHCDVLVVDDEPTICDLIVAVLIQADYQATVAHNGAEAMQALTSHLPRLILVDLPSPRRDWAGLVREMQARCGAVPICLISASEDCAAVATELGAQWSLPKPFDLDELLAIVAQACAAHA
jgi:two-component system KDP operon response regulator KdpE